MPASPSISRSRSVSPLSPIVLTPTTPRGRSPRAPTPRPDAGPRKASPAPSPQIRPATSPQAGRQVPSPAPQPARPADTFEASATSARGARRNYGARRPLPTWGEPRPVPLYSLNRTRRVSDAVDSFLTNLAWGGTIAAWILGAPLVASAVIAFVGYHIAYSAFEIYAAAHLA